MKVDILNSQSQYVKFDNDAELFMKTNDLETIIHLTTKSSHFSQIIILNKIIFNRLTYKKIINIFQEIISGNKKKPPKDNKIIFTSGFEIRIENNKLYINDDLCI
jgi:dihydrofolate reductase